ncbi:MAG: putative oxidoreductase, partial [Acidobacteriaceae bacterium]|nr:putative oxidoreductase [Acidobacteriaceae bacterium]
LLLAVDMLGAILFVHLKNGFFAPGGVEFPLTLLSGCLCIALAGAGALSVQGSRGKKRL